MRVLVVHNFYLIGGGEHTVFANEVDLLRKHGNDVFEYTRSNEELSRSRIKLLLSPFSTVWSFKSYHEVRKIIRSEKIEVVHCHNTFPLISPSVYYAARKCNVPVIQTVHNFRFLCPCGIFFREGSICEECLSSGRFKPALRYRCYRNSRVQTLVVVMMLKIHRMLGTYSKINYIFLTPFTMEKFRSMIDFNKCRSFIKPNFVVNEGYQRKISDGGDHSFVFAGRLEESKGIKMLIEWWKDFPDDYVLHIYGDGPLREYVESACKNSNNIIFYGFCSQERVMNDLRISHGLIFPSLLYETFGMSIAESFSVGCPVITTNIGNPASLVRESGAGAIFEPDKAVNLQNAIEDIIANNDVYSEKALRYYEKNLSPEENYKRLIEIYETCRNNQGSYLCR